MLNPFEPGFFDWPYAQYAAVREHDPVHRSPFAEAAWILFRYDDVLQLLRDSTTSVEDRNALPSPMAQQFEHLLGDRAYRRDKAMLNLDPPDHDRLRRLVSKAFNPKMVDALRPRIRELIDTALDRVASRGEMDVIADLAFPLPFVVISEMLGMPEADRDRLRDWSHTLTRMLEPILTEDDVRAAMTASDHMEAHIAEAIEWKRREPADDLLTALIAAEDGGDVLSSEELVAQVLLLFIAGHETTVNLIGNGTLALLRHPDQLARLCDDPSLDANAIEELLRFDSPVQFSRRISVQPLELRGQAIEPGSFVLTCLASANHDAARWGDTADDLDLGRDGAAQHVSFGSGIHHCLGAALARVEAQLAIPTFVRRFPGVALAQPDATPAWNGRLVLRGLDRLPVTL